MLNWIRFRNTYLQVPWLFPAVIGDRQFDAVLQNRPRRLDDYVQRVLERVLWFWPRVIEARGWVAGAAGKAWAPQNYAKMDADGERLLGWVERVCPARDAAILDVGCNCGRHMIYLAHHGYTNLTGVDAMGAAIELFARHAPDVFPKASVHHDLFQRFLMRQPDRAYDTTYSHGATIELVHPSFDIVAHLCRITRRNICLILLENDGFPRDWIGQFARHGFKLLHGDRPMAPESRASLLVFQRGGAA